MHWRTWPANFIRELNTVFGFIHPPTSRVSGSAVQIRHYPVTVSVEKRCIPYKRHWSSGSGKAASIR
jgi:hypothetical protein